MADQVDLGRARDRQDVANLRKQLFATHLGAVGRRDLRHEHAGAVLAQGLWNAVEVVHAQERIESEQPMHQHHRVARLGGTALGLGGGREGQASKQQHGKAPQEGNEHGGLQG